MLSLSNIDLLAFLSTNSVDKVVGSFDLLTASRSVAAATLSGGLYLPKSDNFTVANPFKRKALITMIWSIDGINFYPQRPHIYNPGNPIPAGKVGATMGARVDDATIYFDSVHFIGAQVDYTIRYVLDFIDG